MAQLLGRNDCSIHTINAVEYSIARDRCSIDKRQQKMSTANIQLYTYKWQGLSPYTIAKLAICNCILHLATTLKRQICARDLFMQIM